MDKNREQKSLCAAVLMQEAYIETIRPTIEGIYNEVMRYWFPEGELVSRRDGEPITDYKRLYRYDGDCAGYYEECKKVLAERGWKPAKPDCCPLLEAEEALRDTKRRFAEACIAKLPPQVDITIDDLLRNLDHYKQFIDINMRYWVQFVDTDQLQAKLKGDA